MHIMPNLKVDKPQQHQATSGSGQACSARGQESKATVDTGAKENRQKTDKAFFLQFFKATLTLQL